MCFLGLKGWLGGVAGLDKCAGRGAAAPLPFLNSSCFHLSHLFPDQRHRQRHHRQNHRQQQIIVTILIIITLIAIFVRRPVWISFIVVPTPPWRPLNADLVLSGRRLAFFGSKLDNWLDGASCSSSSPANNLFPAFTKQTTTLAPTAIRFYKMVTVYLINTIANVTRRVLMSQWVW